MSDAHQQVLFGTRAQWRQWLMEHHHDTPGIWLVTWKKGSSHQRLPYNDIIEEAGIRALAARAAGRWDHAVQRVSQLAG